MIISLIGYRGTGKSTVGRLVAEKLKIQHLDSDDEIIRRSGCSITEIFETKGEEFFRELESQVVANLMTHSDVVISWGGGAILGNDNRMLIKRSDHVVWLTASSSVLNQRIHADVGTKANRPALSNLSSLEEIKSILEKRKPLYDQCASVTIDTDSKSVEVIASEIVDNVLSGR